MNGTRVGVCGLGRMGAAIAAGLAGAGYDVIVWNRTAVKAEELAQQTGVRTARTAAEVARDAEIVLTMVSDGKALLSVIEGPDGLLAGLRTGTVVVDCSTVGVEAALAAHRALRQVGVDFVDCPVSGSVGVAERGQLGLMAGGSEDAIDRILPVLTTIGRTVVRTGPAGSGAATKLAINGILHSFNTAICEAAALSDLHGVPLDRFLEVLSSGVLANPFVSYKLPLYRDPTSETVQFSVRLAAKDLSLAGEAARNVGQRTPLMDAALSVHERAIAHGLGEKDMARLLEQAQRSHPNADSDWRDDPYHFATDDQPREGEGTRTDERYSD